MVGGGPQWQQQQLQPEGDGERLTLTSSMPFRSLEEDPQWGLFLPFDSLEFSFVGGAIGVCRPVPDEVIKEELGGSGREKWKENFYVVY